MQEETKKALVKAVGEQAEKAVTDQLTFVMDKTLDRFWSTKMGQLTEDVAAARSATQEEKKNNKKEGE